LLIFDYLLLFYHFFEKHSGFRIIFAENPFITLFHTQKNDQKTCKLLNFCS